MRFCGLRFSRSDFIFSSTCVKVFIEMSKIDTIGKEGRFQSQLLVKICPLKQLKYYLALSKISKNSNEIIFRSLSTGKEFSVCTRNKPISYYIIRESFTEVLKALSLDCKNYGLHSQLKTWWGLTCRIQR